MPDDAIRYTINAAFFAEIKEHNETYNDMLARLSEFCSRNCSPTKVQQECGPFLHLLREVVARQFELEETFGYVSIRNPSLPQAADEKSDRVRSEHAILAVFLHELSERFDGLQYQGTLDRDLASFLDDLRSFEAKLIAHEQNESELIASRGHARNTRS